MFLILRTLSILEGKENSQHYAEYMSPSSDANGTRKTVPTDPLENIVSINGQCRLLSLTVPPKTEIGSVTGTLRFLSA
jgi:hypothetical protein